MRWMLALVLIMTAVLAQGAAQGAAATWDELVSAAQGEGRVVVKGPPFPELREEFPAAFKARFGITVEYLGGRTSDQTARLRAERAAGRPSTIDVTIGGVQSMVTFYQEKMLIALRPALILPEVVDGSKWKKGALWFSDPEQQYVLRLSDYVTTSFYINTDKVKPGDLRSARDLLDPKWRGKISMGDPTVPGSSSNTAAQFYVELGEAFVKQLYVDQKPVISRDTRQMADWLLRGAYPITFSADTGELEKLRMDGMPVMAMGEMPDLRPSVSAGSGLVAVFANSQHPAAAKLFVNWLASKEGLEIWSRATLTAPTRNDIDEASFLPPEIIPRPGVQYFDGYDWTFTMTTKEEVRLRLKEMMGR